MSRPPAPLLGQLLVVHGLITDSDLQTALRTQKLQGGRIGEILVGMGALGEAELARMLKLQTSYLRRESRPA